jgi:hypothetical protein
MQDFTRRHAIASGLAAAGLGFSGLARAQELAPTTVANAAGNVNITLQQMLRDLNIYEKYGLKPNLMAVADGSKIMGGLIGGTLLVEGYFAKLMYLSLYKMHELALHGWVKVGLDTVARLIVRRTEPHVKLH